MNHKEKKLFLQEVQQQDPKAKIPEETSLFVKENEFYIVSDTIREIVGIALRIRSVGLKCAVRKNRHLELTEQGKYILIRNQSP